MGNKVLLIIKKKYKILIGPTDYFSEFKNEHETELVMLVTHIIYTNISTKINFPGHVRNHF